MRAVALLLMVLLILLAPPALRAADDAKPVEETSTTATTPAEAELGKKVAESIEKEYKLVKDEEGLKRLNAITAEIAPFSQRPDVIYTVRIIDTPALNAMSIPGGIIYVTKGLYNAVESDHEMAGVLAHEIAHNSLYHMKRMAAESKQALFWQMLTVLTTVYATRNSHDGDVSAAQILTASELIKQSVLNGYSIKYEQEADENAVEYLMKTKKYNPIGLYSVILGFLQIERSRGLDTQTQRNIYHDHPFTIERKEYLETKLKDQGVKFPLNLWPVVNFHAETVPPTGDEKGFGVKLGSVEVIKLTAAENEVDAKTRAEEAVAAINRRLNTDYIHQFDVDHLVRNGQAFVRIRNIPVLTLTQADAEAAGVTLEALATLTKENIKSAIWYELVKRS